MTPFEIFRERARVERNEEPLYRKQWKPKPSRSFIPVPNSWWSRYGYKWVLDAVKVTMRATMPMGVLRIPIMRDIPVFVSAELPPERPNYEVRTYEFQPAGWLQILTPSQYKRCVEENWQSFEHEFWRQAERLINENTKVTTS